MKRLFFLLFFVPNLTKAQKNYSKTQNLLWTRYHQTIKFTNNILWANEVDNRIFFKNGHQNQLIAHSHLHYRFNENIETSVGLTYSYINFVNPDSPKGFKTPEIRPFQEFYLRQKLSDKWKIQHRFRSEQRFFRKNDGINLLEGYRYNGRARYQVAVTYQLSKKFDVKANDEIFINFDKNITYNTFDQNRAYVGLSYQISPQTTAELGFLKSVSQKTSGNEYIARNNLRFTLFHTLNLIKKQ